jgi:hypothetical protein
MQEPGFGEKLVIIIGFISTMILIIRIMTSPGACIPLPDTADHKFLCFGIHWEDQK